MEIEIPGVVRLCLPVVLLSLGACSGGSDGTQGPVFQPTPPGPQIALEDAFPNLNFIQPVGMFQAPGDASRWYLVQKGGSVIAFNNDPGVSASSVFVNLGARVNAAGEGGLLGLAFHPGFASNRAVFLSYTAGNFESRVSHFEARPDGLTLDPNSETVLLTQDQPFTNHNGGHLAFGPGPAAADQYLYIGFGDGGGSGDPNDEGQDPFSFHGTILRIDVSGLTAYSIPPDNPFANGVAADPEVFAFGFRNPWRFSFDRASGTLWAGDVGQNRFEEIDVVTAGGNYGWRCYEGNTAFNTTNCPPQDQLEFPVAVYEHPAGSGGSVTGGYVYRGSAISALQGVYVFGDFVTGTIRGLIPEGGGQYRAEVLLESGLGIVAFAEDASGELFVIDFSGRVYRVIAGS